MKNLCPYQEAYECDKYKACCSFERLNPIHTYHCDTLNDLKNKEDLYKYKYIKKPSYDYINPNHYKEYSVEVITMMEKVFGLESTIKFCEMTAFKYRMRLGTKPSEPIERDLEKEAWYLNKRKELLEKLNQ